MRKLFLVCLLTLLILSASTHAQSIQDQAHAYLDRNALSGIQELVSAAGEKGILIIGEHHGVARNYQFYLHLLRHFPDRKIQLVMEIPPSNAYLYNEYLKTGDESPMNACIQNLRGSCPPAIRLPHPDISSLAGSAICKAPDCRADLLSQLLLSSPPFWGNHGA